MTGMLIEPDFTEVKEAVEPGIYKVRIVAHRVDKWSGKEGKKDTPYIGWTLDTFGSVEAKDDGRKIFHNTPISGPGAFRLKDLFKAAIGEELQGAFDPIMLYGREIEVTVVQQKNNPEYNEIKAVKSLV